MEKITAITGNIGSGKSKVMEILESRGYKTLSADDYTSKAYGIVKEKLVEAFSEDILEGDEISRNKLSKHVFKNQENLSKLNEIMHPVIYKLMAEDSKIFDEIFVEIPLLFESGMENAFANIWLVMSDEDKKIDRASKRDGKSKEEIKKRLFFQQEDEKKIDKVHIIIENNGSIEDLENKIVEILKEKSL